MLQEYEMKIYNVVVDDNNKLVELTQEEFGHFFHDDIYIIDLKGKKHRYVLTWMGPKLNM